MPKMIEEMMMQKRTKTIIDLAQVKKGEKVLILADFHTANLGKLLAAQVHQIDALPILTIIPPLKAHGDPIPEPVFKMAMEVDVIITPMVVSIGHTPLRHEALKRGIKLMVLGEVDEAYLAKGAFDANFHELRPKIEKLAELMTKAKTARVTNAKGTDITMNIEGRRAQPFTGFTGNGMLASPPCLEVNCAPVEGTSEGKIMTDVSIEDLPSDLGFVLLKEPVECTVSGGLVRDIKGGGEAKKLKEYLGSLKDPNIYNIAELGIGMNPSAKADGTSLMDEGSQDNIHIAIGTNEYFPGGTIRAKGHYDLVISFCTLELDGVAVVKDGKSVF
jgi:leucyl aminopeptidase (aminopeptidase T)